MRVRIFIIRNEDPAKDLEIAADLRFDLWAHSPVEIDPDDPATRTRRTADNGTAYFEFETEFPQEVERILQEYNYGNVVKVEYLPTDQHAATT